MPGKVPLFFRCRRAGANVKKPGRMQGQVQAGSARGNRAPEALPARCKQHCRICSPGVSCWQCALVTSFCRQTLETGVYPRSLSPWLAEEEEGEGWEAIVWEGSQNGGSSWRFSDISRGTVRFHRVWGKTQACDLS